jgi:hypothetical protein
MKRGAAWLVLALLAAAPALARASVGLGGSASHATLAVDAHGDALVSWRQGGGAVSLLIPPSGELSHGGQLDGADVSRPATLAGVPDAVALRRSPDGELWALQLIQLGAQSPPVLDFSRWRGAPTTLTLVRAGDRLEGRVAFHGAPVSGLTFTLAGKHPRIYVYLDCFACGGKRGWSPMLGVPPKPDGSFAVLLRQAWVGSRYRATVAGPNLGATLAPDAQTVIEAS